jgi:hypothetical protein
MTKAKIEHSILILLVCLLSAQPVIADVRGDIREKGIEYTKPLEVIMVDGPFFVEGRRYYIAEFIKPNSNIAASLVYDESSSTFETAPQIIKKVLATKDLKKLTVADPLFFALGEPENLITASKYETQNVRNFASFSSITSEEQNILNVFLKDYENTMEDVANVSLITQNILYPGDALEINHIVSPPTLDIKLKESREMGHFSFEGFETLISSYETLYHDYRKLSADLSAFGGGLPEYQPGAIIREKWEVQITKEGILEEVMLIEENGETINAEIELRKGILTYPYEEQITESIKRLGVNPQPPPNRVTSLLSGIFGKIKTFFIGLFGLGALLFINKKKRPPEKKSLRVLLTFTFFVGLFAPTLSYSIEFKGVPTMEDIISQKVETDELIPYTNLATGIDNTTAEELLGGFPLMFKGENAEIRGPYNYYKKPYYYIDIKKEDVSTGHGFLVDAEKLRLVGDQRKAFQLLKTLVFSELLNKKPLYIGEEPDLINKKAKETLESPLDLFLTNLSLNVREGIALEKKLKENPDFEILLNLTENYVEAFVLINNINQLVSGKDTEKLTGGFSHKLYLLDAYSRATRGLSSQEFLLGRVSQYRGRTLNRLPLISQLSFMGLRPSKAQVAHDLTGDLIYDNVYLWRMGTNTNPI